ncbi:tRNA synthetases class II-domain-containing protein [Hypoxylon crocopeplum]|nr:tRNA synthetases class II-domain-containing protein [Hypoxylon crocopeplum]
MARFLSNSLRKGVLRCVPSIRGQSLSRQCPSIFRLEHIKTLHHDASESLESQGKDTTPETSDSKWDAFKHPFFRFPDPTEPVQFEPGAKVNICGFIGKRKDMSSSLSFCDIDASGSDAAIQIVSNWQEEGSPQHLAHQDLKNIPAYSPVSVTGTLQESQSAAPESSSAPRKQRWDLRLASVQCLNQFPKDIIVSKDTVWPPKSRHLQLRFDPFLRDRLRFRTMVQTKMRQYLGYRDFLEIETPVLFKSTPEGSREFLVPTRRQGYAYALPQSPQQYKQILMAGGVTKYFQFAKCFRDEDHRADRQPEFTQLDLEMAFSRTSHVKKIIYGLVSSLFGWINNYFIPEDINGTRRLVFVGPGEVSSGPTGGKTPETRSDDKPRRRFFFKQKSLSYDVAMKYFGTDKPDLRLCLPTVTNIYNMAQVKPPSEFIKMITSLENPIVEGCKFRLNLTPVGAGKFIRQFMDSLSSTTVKLNPESTPAVFVYDSRQPLTGLASLGHTAAERLRNKTDKHWPKCQEGDIVIMHARKDEPFYGSSTELGRLRTAIHRAAVDQGLIPKDNSFKLVWMYGFPLFTPDGDDPGQGGTAGFSSTHHPFTSPLTPKDFELLKTDPLKARGDHYDLVINGVEVGGGSRRIHVAEVQEYVLRDVLKLSDEGVAEFSHLLEALRAGCPPHAGFAFGFDRLISVLLDVPSIRDVMAFPKSNKGEDVFVGSPAKVTPKQRETYHLRRAGEPSMLTLSQPVMG